MDNNMVSKIVVGILIYANSKFKATCKNANFECRYTSELIPKKIRLNNIIFAILPFSHKITLTELLSSVLWSLLLLMKPSYALQMVHSNTKNAKSKVLRSFSFFSLTFSIFQLFHFQIFLIFFSIFPFFLAPLFPVGQQKFPGEKCQGALVPYTPDCHADV